jgi:hypothetical protein
MELNTQSQSESKPQNEYQKKIISIVEEATARIDICLGKQMMDTWATCMIHVLTDLDLILQIWNKKVKDNVTDKFTENLEIKDAREKLDVLTRKVKDLSKSYRTKDNDVPVEMRVDLIEELGRVYTQY